jgi:hypothetical protein
MSERVQDLPKPTPLSSMPFPPVPERFVPRPAPLGLATGVITGRLELALLLKVTYQFEPGKTPRRADQQLPLSLKNEEHDELAPGVKGSMKAVPELLAFTSGTDVIVRAHARPPKPRSSMRVSVTIGNHRHTAEVTGRRRVDFVNGKLKFTDPELFEAMPLRYELAYGGVDTAFEAAAAASAQATIKPEDLRRMSAFAKDFLQGVPPIAYPRNRYGKGYAVFTDPKAIAGRELPSIEFPDDRLTPERLVPSKPLRWLGQPVPAGFDFMDALMFPRSAMMGLPPMSEGNLDEIGEVRRGQVPAGYCRGNAMYAEREQIPGLIHPELARCAPIGLRLPFLQGNEVVILQGMNPAIEEWQVPLPGERPMFLMPIDGKERELAPQLFQLFLDADKKQLCLIWGARTAWPKPLKPGEDKELLASVRLREPWVKTAGHSP